MNIFVFCFLLFLITDIFGAPIDTGNGTEHVMLKKKRSMGVLAPPLQLDPTCHVISCYRNMLNRSNRCAKEEYLHSFKQCEKKFFREDTCYCLFFYIQSSGDDLLSFNPYVYVPNYCGAIPSPDGICTVKAMMVRIPEENISPTHIPVISYRIGDIELSDKVRYEEMEFGSIFGGVLLKNEHCMQDFFSRKKSKL